MTTDIFDVFGVEDGNDITSAYHRIGYPFNPFRERVSETPDDSGPFFTQHIVEQLQQIQAWMRAVHQDNERQPLSLAGNIGAGKTRILSHLQRRLSMSPNTEKIVAEVLVLSDTGFSRASIGGLLVVALERMSLPWALDPPEGVFPLVWAIATSPSFPAEGNGLIMSALRKTHSQTGSEREELARLFSRWLQRVPLSASETKKLDLYRKIDWEGELLRYLAELLRLARAADVLNTCFLFIDQLEDLFRPTFSELRRSRLLTDLRGLIDEIDADTPIGLVLSWTPDFSASNSPIHIVEMQFKRGYEALFSRMERRRINLPLLRYEYAGPFARSWIEALKNIENYKPKLQPDIDILVGDAWTLLNKDRKLLPGGGGTATPRDLLSALAKEVDLRANIG